MKAWVEYMTAIRRLCDFEFNKADYRKMVVFIDCNPSFSIYTQMALVSSDKLVVPMMADFSSVEGIKGVFMLLFGKYPSVALKNYAEDVITFNTQIERFNLQLPVLWEFAFNNYTVNLGVAKAYDSLRTELINFCYKQYKTFPSLFASTNKTISSQEEWEATYVSDIKDFHTAGKVSASLGIPLFNLPKRSKYTMPDGSEVEVVKARYETALENIELFATKF
jgi:hypothetical protein